MFERYFQPSFLQREFRPDHTPSEAEVAQLLQRLETAVTALNGKAFIFLDEDGLCSETESLSREAKLSQPPYLRFAEFDLDDTCALHAEKPADLVFVHITNEVFIDFALALHGRGLPVFGVTTEIEPQRPAYHFAKNLFCSVLQLPHAPKYHEANLLEYVTFWERVAQALAVDKNPITR